MIARSRPMLEMMRDHCVEELVLAPKSRVERSDRVARSLRERDDGDRFEIAVLEQLESGLDVLRPRNCLILRTGETATAAVATLRLYGNHDSVSRELRC